VKKSPAQYQALLATVRPRDPAGRTRRRMAAEELQDLHRLDAKLKAMKAELKTAVAATSSHLMDIPGIGPAGAARILADVGDVARFPGRNHFASWTGTAPIDASSGQHLRHRLSRAGNRRLGHVLYLAAFVQLRHDTPGRAYYRRKLAAGKTPMEALRCLRRRLSDAVYRQLAADAASQPETSPGGHPGASVISSAAGPPPDTGTSDQPLPGPAHPTLPPPGRPPKGHGPGSCHPTAARPRCQRRSSGGGSGSLSVVAAWLSWGHQDSFAQEVEVGTAIHLPFEHLDAVDVAFHRAGVPGTGQARGDGVEVVLDSADKGVQAGQADGAGQGEPSGGAVHRGGGSA
jgi:Transposase IS116/IS110/IS902 family